MSDIHKKKKSRAMLLGVGLDSDGHEVGRNLKLLLICLSLLAIVRPASAQTWTRAAAPVALWQAIASSADGNKLAAAVGGSGGIYVSTNSGTAWSLSSAPAAQDWFAIASSADGTKLVAGTFDGKVYTSTNSGGIWTSNGVLNQSRFALASSADGNKLVAATVGGQVFLSTNSGNSWAASSAPTNNMFWVSAASSADGTKLAAAWQLNFNGGIYTSTNSGLTWTSNNLPSLNWTCVASSADGNRLIAAVGGSIASGPVYASANGGASWTLTSLSNLHWENAAVSAAGSTFVAGTFDSHIYISRNAGSAWTSNSSPQGYCSSIAASADGTKLAAVVQNGSSSAIYLWQIPRLSISLSTNITRHLRRYSTNKVAVLSWPTNATVFTLQESSNLTTMNWLTLTNVPIVTNGQNRALIPFTNGSRFYRLKNP